MYVILLWEMRVCVKLTSFVEKTVSGVIKY